MDLPYKEQTLSRSIKCTGDVYEFIPGTNRKTRKIIKGVEGTYWEPEKGSLGTFERIEPLLNPLPKWLRILLKHPFFNFRDESSVPNTRVYYFSETFRHPLPGYPLFPYTECIFSIDLPSDLFPYYGNVYIYYKQKDYKCYLTNIRYSTVYISSNINQLFNLIDVNDPQHKNIHKHRMINVFDQMKLRFNDLERKDKIDK